MKRWRVHVNGGPTMNGAAVYMFADSQREVRDFLLMLNPLLQIEITLVSDAVIGVPSYNIPSAPRSSGQ